MSEDDPLANLRALAEKQDDLDRLARKAKPPTNPNTAKQRPVSVGELIGDFGGNLIEADINGDKKRITEIIFGPKRQTQLTFRPNTELTYSPSKDRSKGRIDPVLYEVFAQWSVSLKGKTSRHDTRRELNRSNRGLWDEDEEEGQPSTAFKAATQLLACRAEMEAKQETASSVGPEAAEGALYIYPKPEIETLREELAKAEDQRNEMSNHLIMAHDAISLTIEALSKHGKKLQKAFELLQRDQWPQDIAKLQESALYLATKFQRPPTKAELKRRHDPCGRLDPSSFARLLDQAGLCWCPHASRVT